MATASIGNGAGRRMTPLLAPVWGRSGDCAGCMRHSQGVPSILPQPGARLRLRRAFAVRFHGLNAARLNGLMHGGEGTTAMYGYEASGDRWKGASMALRGAQFED